MTWTILISFYLIGSVNSFFGWYGYCRNPDAEVVEALHNNFTLSVHGQHLAIPTVLSLIQGHFTRKEPSKALVLSFHGPTGSGKNFVASKIAYHMFPEGMSSPYVLFFSGTRDFLEPELLESYKKSVSEQIKKAVSSCQRSLFIFDETDKMLDGLFEVLKPFVDHHPTFQDVDYRRSTFIFLSNIGSQSILKITYTNRKAGRRRGEIELGEFKEALRSDLFNSNGAMHFCSLISNYLVDAFVPFLPLEKEHILLCIQDSAKAHGYSSQNLDTLFNFVLNELNFKPETDSMFSSSGCRGVDQAVLRFISKEKFSSYEKAKSEL